ncbi:hypothetical protein MOC16_gp305 [Klebsiella phage vB_KpM_FBKp24]|uniref:Uncharacterized protein n=1 Tax=Klebsiella phage vB_KpM_FBKp24 TaxID=2801834 RepID=A0A7U0J782_9CAUD|nr:hypothetical protein [Klebsiella pneumoniae]YP_010298745.1 hypothetical protein MOC16_gp305 [Klebsiella phage vB_KpM_FBKp24]QQV92262.1 hypothetical protein vBKpMFBKp24_108 [Klebsiella phage vB_KpM_FBKp24]
MNMTQRVAKEWEDNRPVENAPAPVLVLNRYYAKKLYNALGEDIRTNRGEDILMRVYNVDDGLLAIWLGNKSYWQIRRSQAFRLHLKLEAFLSKKSSKRLVMTFDQVRYLQIPLMAVNKNAK